MLELKLEQRSLAQLVQISLHLRLHLLEMHKTFVSIDLRQLRMLLERLLIHFPNIHLRTPMPNETNCIKIFTLKCKSKVKHDIPHLERISINNRPLRVHEEEQDIAKNRRNMFTNTSSPADEP